MIMIPSFRYFGKTIQAIQGLYSRGGKSDLYQSTFSKSIFLAVEVAYGVTYSYNEKYPFSKSP